jgi:hypothetical protein
MKTFWSMPEKRKRFYKDELKEYSQELKKRNLQLAWRRPGFHAANQLATLVVMPTLVAIGIPE